MMKMQTLVQVVVVFFLARDAAIGASGTAIRQTDAIVADDPRPLAEAVQIFERRYGWVVTYEDPPYEHDSEITDITKLVRNDGRTDIRTLVPRGGSLTVNVPPPSPQATISEVLSSIQLMLKANESAGNPGIFRVSNTGYAFHVSPTSRKLRDGRIVSHTSIFNVRVSLPAQKGRTVYRALQDILTVVSQSSGYKVGLGVVPTNALSTSTFDEPASEQTAEELLVRVFDATQLGISWRLLYAPDLRMFAMNIHVVRNRPDQ